MTSGGDVAELKALLAGRMFDLARELAPDGRRQGRYWMARNPTRDDRRAGSFWITVDGPMAGAWKDAATDEKGDVLGLISYTMKIDQFPAVLKWARGWLGIDEMPEAQRRQAREDAVARRRRAEADAAVELARSRRQALAIWLDARADLSGSPVERYLAGRGIAMGALAQPPRALRCGQRFHRENGGEWPAMIACMTGPDDTLWALHTTFLARDGSGKAPVDPPRKIWPSFSGACVRLAKGETGLAPRRAAEQGLLDTLVICEGIEDGLSIALACPELRVWAAGSLGNLANVMLPQCAAEVVVAADNDWGKPAAEAQLDKALAALAAQGRRVSVARSPIGKDLNDALRGIST